MPFEYTPPPPGGGLYVIWLSETHYYGGRTTNFCRRWLTYWKNLQAGKANARMQNAYNKYGRFEPQVLTLLEKTKHLNAEQEWLDANFRKPGCVNLSPLAAGGCESRSEVSRKKQSETIRNNPELLQKARASIAQNGCRDPETLRANAQKAAEHNRGRTLSDEHRRAIGDAHLGRKNTPETKALMSESAKARAIAHPTVHSPETRSKISIQQKGRIWINNGTRNRRVSPEKVLDLEVEGWVLGRIGKTTAGHVSIRKDGRGRKVPPADLPPLLADGWVVGVSAKQKGLWIHKGSNRKRVLVEEIPNFLAEGWLRGPGKAKKLAWINKDGKKKRVPPADLPSYEAEGWSLGSGISTQKGLLWIHHPNHPDQGQKRVPPEDLPSYEAQGWVEGQARFATKTLWIHKEGCKAQHITEADLSGYEAQGWSRGHRSQSVEERQARKDKWKDPERREEARQRILARPPPQPDAEARRRAARTQSQKMTGRVWINNGTESRMVPKDEAQVLIGEGWVRGRRPRGP